MKIIVGAFERALEDRVRLVGWLMAWTNEIF